MRRRSYNFNNSDTKIADIISKYYTEAEEYSGILSSICRQTAFVEGALFWFLRSELKVCDGLVVIGLLCILFYFIADAIQYLIGRQIVFKRAKDWEEDFKVKKIKNLAHYEIPWDEDFYCWVIWFFYAKLFFIASASTTLIVGFVKGFF